MTIEDAEPLKGLPNPASSITNINKSSVVTKTMKCEEELLREEIRALREISLKLYQWGVTLLASLETALYFIRKEALASAIQSRQLPDSTIDLPLNRYLPGTAFLIIIALIFFALSSALSSRYRSYVEQLNEFKVSQIEDLAGGSKTLRILTKGLYFIFPALDIIFRLYFHLEVSIR